MNMLVVSKIPNEPDGRTVTIGENTYDFAPNTRGHNVCEVEDKSHLSRFLAIDEGAAYELYDPDATKKAAATPKAAPARQKKGDPFSTQKDEILDDSAHVPSDAELMRDRDDSQDAKIELKGDAEKFGKMTRKQLEAAFKKRFGRKPSTQTENAAIIARLTA
jgi:hypothetical protein